ncbi:Tfp pilus assembly protein FimT [Anaerosolibacter carboniphilus]|uniref:Tfp pilus assembly protein FimT n=1 Tax=Anaerosolibacter carboniphilus TaxID=1417629 RepID=A0A841L0A8_9FIRM|nr:pilus assembly PilX N-terminal domain-containing protein [Anaerosolibacter carboniphilus]MBB6216602.1 Tfp pilus assembly protein FimT [Anaerosolibacter carboniphilus]
MKFNNDRGSTLSFVIVIIAVLTVLGGALLSAAVAEAKQVGHEEKKIKAYYIARSGADATAQYIISNQSNEDKLEGIIGHTGTGNLAGYTFDVDVSDNPAEETITIKATASVGEIKNTAQLILFYVKKVVNNEEIIEYRRGPWQ